ncbi:MAG TPA: zinc dependent phospholipase C family protein [Puia sp.]|nr:zinc dependent phospholipase C family protein [Puia sp.]
MKKLPVLAFFLLASLSLVFAWGTWGHQHINRAALFALPDEMRPFFYNHIDYLTEEAVGPDLRKYSLNDRAEYPRHFIDLESYDNLLTDSLMPTNAEIRNRFDEKYLQQSGILPWYIQEMTEKLTNAFREKRKAEILFLAADLGHYIGDAHMPLHTAINHNGQITGQIGIHAFWEAQLPELFGETYNLNTGNAKYIDNINKEIWKIIWTSHMLADSLLAIDRRLKAGLDKSLIYQLDSSGNIKKNKFNDLVHSLEYSKKYHAALNGMIERQLRGAISETADFWFTAWVNAGRPDLNELDPADLTERNRKNYQRERNIWKKGKLSGLKPDLEF